MTLLIEKLEESVHNLEIHQYQHEGQIQMLIVYYKRRKDSLLILNIFGVF